MEYAHVSGKRKEAIARTTIRPGKGIVRVNSKLFEYSMPRLARERIRQVLLLSDGFIDLGKVDIDIVSEGGGVMGQAEAIACSLARTLLAYTGSDQLKEIFVKYDRTFIAGDHRQTEVHKPSQSSSGPRHKKQKSYR
jgi:small subunit ribosomal protein S9